ncbi:hypothetical protein H6G93_13900 [Nostoc sp. FACHB-973]|nr:hypothetical protein [Nostoc sp. FACHB-973]
MGSGDWGDEGDEGDKGDEIEPLSFVVEPLSFVVEPLSFVVEPLSFVVEPLSFVVEPLSFVVEPLSFVVEPLSFVVEPLSLKVLVFGVISFGVTEEFIRRSLLQEENYDHGNLSVWAETIYLIWEATEAEEWIDRLDWIPL